MAAEPDVKRTFAFIDGQNLFSRAKDAFGYKWANYDPLVLAQTVCAMKGWDLARTCFYTGIHDPTENAFLHGFWTAKLAVIKSRPDVDIFTRQLRYSPGPAGQPRIPREKGIDVRIALDILRRAIDGSYDVALIFSQDQDLSEAAEEVMQIARQQGRWIKVASAFPDAPHLKYRRGVDKTDWIRIDRTLYDVCLDPIDYRPSQAKAPTV